MRRSSSFRPKSGAVLVSLALVLSLLSAFTISTISTGVVQAAPEIQKHLENRAKPILTVDGYMYKDLNDNGVVDPYENWMLPVENRVEDLLSRMTLNEKVGLMFQINLAGLFSSPNPPYDDATLDLIRNHVGYWGVTTFLNNTNGSPDNIAGGHNVVQEIAEGTRLGIPVDFSCDRFYNVWGGYRDNPEEAYGTCQDMALVNALLEEYGREMRAVGYTMTLNPSLCPSSQSTTVFGTWGENQDLQSALICMAILAYQGEELNENSVTPCIKHYPPVTLALCLGNNIEYPMRSWKAGFDAGAQYIMLRYGPGIFGGTAFSAYSAGTIAYARENLGFNGIVLTDWRGLATDNAGTLDNGTLLATLSAAERYQVALEAGVDQIGGENVAPLGEGGRMGNYPSIVVELVENGVVPEERINESARRILARKFAIGLFEDPYVDPEAALAMRPSPAANALENELQVKSAVLLKNDGILPLGADLNVFVSAAAAAENASLKAAVSRYATVVDDLAGADVAIIRATSVAATITNVARTGTPVIAALDMRGQIDVTAIAPNENVRGILMMPYNITPDHGSKITGVFYYTDPDILADMLFGHAGPSGKSPFQLPRKTTPSQTTVDLQWPDTPYDLGTTVSEREQIVAAIKAGQPVPINLGDPLFMYGYGMRYGLAPNFVYSDLTLSATKVKVGEPFTVSFTITNNGYDGCTVVEAYVGDDLVGSKFMGVNGGLSACRSFTIVVNEPDVYTITIGSLSGAVVVGVVENIEGTAVVSFRELPPEILSVVPSEPEWDPWEAYTIAVTVRDNNTLADLDNVIVMAYSSPLNPADPDSTRDHYTWWYDGSWHSSLGASYMVPELCSAPENLSATEGTYVFAVRLAKTAVSGTWDLYAEAVDSYENVGSLENAEAVSVWVYTEFSLDRYVLRFAGRQGDTVGAELGPSVVTVTTNEDFSVQVRMSGPWTTDDLTMPTEATTANGVPLKDYYQTVLAGVGHGEDVEAGIAWELSIPVDQPLGEYRTTFYVNVAH